MKILVTGAAGFIGAALCYRLVEQGGQVIGIDNLNPYYDVELKRARLARLVGYPGFEFLEFDIADRAGMKELRHSGEIDRIMHLAAQAGVRYSIDCPEAYIDSNLLGFANILELARGLEVTHLAYASSSSVYGANTSLPFRESDNVDHPISLYAASKKANELMAHTYSHLYGIPTTGLRFFTVYGPWGRPDMALFKFTRGILAGDKIPVYNNGQMVRDFTYIDDIVEGLIRVLARAPEPDSSWNPKSPDPASGTAPYRIYNIGNNRPVELMEYIKILEHCLGKPARLQMLPMQDGDVPATYADVSRLARDFNYQPQTTVAQGIERFVDWYRDFYHV